MIWTKQRSKASINSKFLLALCNHNLSLFVIAQSSCCNLNGLVNQEPCLPAQCPFYQCIFSKYAWIGLLQRTLQHSTKKERINCTDRSLCRCTPMLFTGNRHYLPFIIYIISQIDQMCPTQKGQHRYLHHQMIRWVENKLTSITVHRPTSWLTHCTCRSYAQAVLLCKEVILPLKKMYVPTSSSTYFWKNITCLIDSLPMFF